MTDATRPGVVVISHGWGSRVFDPRGGAEPVVFGVNRNALVGGTDIDPLSQVSPLNSTWVRVEPLTVHLEDRTVETIPSPTRATAGWSPHRREECRHFVDEQLGLFEGRSARCAAGPSSG